MNNVTVHYEVTQKLKTSMLPFGIPEILEISAKYHVNKGIKSQLLPSLHFETLAINNVAPVLEHEIIAKLNPNDIEILLWEDFDSKMESEDDLWEELQ
jgi:hypothetical protein